MRCVCVRVLDQQVEEHDLRLLRCRGTGGGRNRLDWARRAAAEMDDRGVLGVQRGTRRRTTSLLSSTVILPISRLFWRRSVMTVYPPRGNESGRRHLIRRSAAGQTGVLMLREGKSCKRLTQCASPFFQRTRKTTYHAPVPRQRKRDKRERYSWSNVAVAENQAD